jgi:MraZ protein
METEPQTPPPPKRPLGLSGEHDIDLDNKNRISIPSAFRKEIIEARNETKLVIVIGRNRVAWMYPKDYYRNELVAQRKTHLMPGEDEEKFNEAYYGMTFDVEWDANGRVVVPEKIIKRTNMGKNLTLVGARDHVAVWNREDWERRVTAHLESWNDITDRERQLIQLQQTKTAASQ